MPRRHRRTGTAVPAFLLPLLLCLVSPPLAAQAAAPAAASELGHVDFPNSGAPEAQDAFLHGVLLLHSFEYEDAREAFREARRIDPGFALAYWGEALTWDHPLWGQQDRPAARAVLAALGATPEERLTRAPSERERGYLRAVEALYGDGGEVQRDAAYERAMGELVAAYPDDLEARAFHALSILGTAEGVRDFRVYMRAAAEAEEVFAVAPRHPGALHYLIHSYDDPVHAPLGLRAARVYAEVAPAASHAQHMISHIYVALGRWRDSLDANRRSFAVSAERRQRKGLGTDALNLHALHWLQYAYLQLGRNEEARGLLDDMAGYAAGSGSPRATFYLASMRATWVAETGDPAPPPGPDPAGLAPDAMAAALFADGYAAWKAGAAPAAIRTSRQTLEDRLGPETEPGDDTAAGGNARVLAHELRAIEEMAGGRTAAAIAELAVASELEERLPLDYGPPPIVKPSHELFGEVLLTLGRTREAREQFAAALLRAPRRRLSLAGLATAARAEGDAAAADAACAELAAILDGADAGVGAPEACPQMVPEMEPEVPAAAS